MGIDACMYVKVPYYMSKEDITQLSYAAGVSFGHEHFCRYTGEHNISVITVSTQSTTLRVNLWTRYYGPGYERGNCALLVTLAEWLERAIPGCTVLYGGDVDVEEAEIFDKEARSKLLDHLASPNGRAYFTQRLFEGNIAGPICVLCNAKMVQYNSGPGPYCGTFSCGGCGVVLETKDGGRTFSNKEDAKW
jgi:hypothetical protein